MTSVEAPAFTAVVLLLLLLLPPPPPPPPFALPGFCV